MSAEGILQEHAARTERVLAALLAVTHIDEANSNGIDGNGIDGNGIDFDGLGSDGPGSDGGEQGSHAYVRAEEGVVGDG